MDYDDFVTRVQEAAGLGARDEAVRAIGATLGTLGELLSRTERDNLAAELHKPLKEYLYTWIDRPNKGLNRPHRFRLEEFYNRVSARSEAGYPAAVKHSLAVMSVLRQAVSRGELADAFRELPDEYEELLSGKPRGPLSPSIVE